MILRSHSGGGFQAAEDIKSTQIIIEEYGIEADVIGGVSQGIITALAESVHFMDNGALEHALFLSINNVNEVFKVRPDFNIRTGVRLIKNLICGKKSGVESLGVQDITPLIQKFLPKSRWKDWKKSDVPTVYTSGLEMPTRKVYLQVLNDIPTYEGFIKAISIGMHIPVFTQSVNYLGKDFIDTGGAWNNIGALLLQEYPETKHLISTYTRGNDIEREDNNNWNNKIPDALMHSINSLIAHSSKQNQYIEMVECERIGAKYTPVFLPAKLDGFYDADIEDIERIVDAACISTREWMEKEPQSKQDILKYYKL